MAVMCPVFDEVGRLLDEGEPEAKDWELAARLAAEMSNSFETEDQRIAAVRPLLREIFVGEGIDFDPLEVAPKKGKSDGTIRYRNGMVGNVEFKNEKGAGAGDPYMQNASYYVHFWAQRGGPAVHCCPSLLVEVEGQEIGVSGAALCDRFPCVQPLSDNVPFLMTKFDTRLLLRQARLVMALRVGFEKLSRWYRDHEELLANPQAQFPYAREVTIGAKCVSLTYSGFLHDGKDKEAGFTKPLFLAKREDTGEEVVVKFCAQGYGTEAHQFMADKGLAPLLYGTRFVATNMIMVVMQRVKGVQYDGYTHQAQRGALDAAVSQLHGRNFVHGDLRAPNIIVVKNGVMLLDFDWAQPVATAKYPSVLNYTGIKWPDGARVGAAITKEHDLYMLAELHH